MVGAIKSIEWHGTVYFGSKNEKIGLEFSSTLYDAKGGLNFSVDLLARNLLVTAILGDILPLSGPLDVLSLDCCFIN